MTQWANTAGGKASVGMIRLMDPIDPTSTGGDRTAFNWGSYSGLFKFYRVVGVAVSVYSPPSKNPPSCVFKSGDDEYAYVGVIPSQSIHGTVVTDCRTVKDLTDNRSRPGASIKVYQSRGNERHYYTGSGVTYEAWQSGDVGFRYKKYINIRKFLGCSKDKWNADTYWTDCTAEPSKMQLSSLLYLVCGSNVQSYQYGLDVGVGDYQRQWFIKLRYYVQFRDPTWQTPAGYPVSEDHNLEAEAVPGSEVQLNFQ